MIVRPQYNKHLESNNHFYNVLNYALIKKDFEAVRGIINSVSNFTKDAALISRVSSLFINTPRCKKWFGISESINQSTVNMVFSGNVNIKINNNDDATRIVENFLYDGQLIDTLKEAYSTALSSVQDGKSYILMRTTSEYDLFSGYKVRDQFVEFEVLKQYEVYYSKNKFIKYLKKNIIDSIDNKEKTYSFEYIYTVLENGITTLNIVGYDDERKRLSESIVKNILEINETKVAFDYVPFFEVNIGRGQLPNAIYLEDSLAEALYFKGYDLGNSQSKKFVPEQYTYKQYKDGYDNGIDDRYQTTYITKTSIDGSGIVIQEGKSAIKEITDHMKLDILQACLDAKISPISLGYSLLDNLANNTDTTTTKERVSIRLRETHIGILRIIISKIIKTFLKINKVLVDIVDISIIFDQYITPSIETLTNVLAKQVQFGLKSVETAVRDLNKNEMSDEEINNEVERIMQKSIQRDFNVEQSLNAERIKVGSGDLLKPNNSKEPINNKEDNNLKSSGIVD